MSKNNMYATTKKYILKVVKDELAKYPIIKKMTEVIINVGFLFKQVKYLEESMHVLEKTVEQLKIQIATGTTIVPPQEDPPIEETTETVKPMSGYQAKKIRSKNKFSQEMFAQILGITVGRYVKYEKGQQPIPADIEAELKDIKSMKASELRSKMVDKGIFQNNNRIARQENESKLSLEKQIAQSPYFASEIKELRLKNSYSQKHIAELLQVPKGTYGSWERGTCRMPDKYTAKFQEIVFPELADNVQEDIPVDIEQEKPAKRRENLHSPYTAEDLKNLRLAKQQTQDVISAIIGVHKRTYSDWERGVQPMLDIYTAKVTEIFSMNFPNPTIKVAVEPSVFTSADLKSLRLELKYTQKKMANKLNTYVEKYKSWEQGKATMPKSCDIEIENLRLKINKIDNIEHSPVVDIASQSSKNKKIKEIAVTPEMINKTKHCRELFDCSSEIMAQITNIDFATYDSLENGTLSSLDSTQWERICFLSTLSKTQITKLKYGKK